MGDRNLHASEVEAEATLALIQLIRLRKAWVREWVPKESDCVYYIFGVLVYGYIHKETPSAIDVYRGRTELEITMIIRDSTIVSRDSIVVFK